MKKIFKKLFSVNRIDLISNYFNTSNSFILEIGVHRAEFSRALLKNFNPKKLVLVDPWIAFNDSEYDSSFYGNKLKNGQSLQDQYYDEVVKSFDKEIKNYKVEIVRDTSDNFFTKNVVEFDLIYIDGNHIYDYVKKDIFNSLKFLKQDGIIVLDDYKLNGWWKDGVTKAVNYYHKNNKVDLLAKHDFFNYHHQCIISKPKN
jgi:hypothetical protein